MCNVLVHDPDRGPWSSDILFSLSSDDRASTRDRGRGFERNLGVAVLGVGGDAPLRAVLGPQICGLFKSGIETSISNFTAPPEYFPTLRLPVTIILNNVRFNAF